MAETPSASPAFTVSAPAKAILFGEHATLYGHSALALALELRITVRVVPAEEFRVNNYRVTRFNTHRHKQIAFALDYYWDEARPVHFHTTSSIPSASGLGSSSAFTAATVGALAGLEELWPEGGDDDPVPDPSQDDQKRDGTDEGSGPMSPETIARRSFQVEWASHGKASPLDTCCACFGGGVLMTPTGKPQSPGQPLLTIEKEGREWSLHSIPVPAMQLVVGYTGTKSKTGPQVAKVARFAGHSGFAKEILADIGEIAREGVRALARGDLERVGELMRSNHDLLTILGLNPPQVQKLYDAASRHALGAKMTGAGGGGSIIALLAPDDIGGVRRTVKAIERAGGRAIVAGLAQEGLMLNGSAPDSQ